MKLSWKKSDPLKREDLQFGDGFVKVRDGEATLAIRAMAWEDMNPGDVVMVDAWIQVYAYEEKTKGVKLVLTSLTRLSKGNGAAEPEKELVIPQKRVIEE